MANVLQQSTFYQNFIRLSLDRIVRPSDVNRSLTEGGLWVEFTLRVASNSNLDEMEVYNELFRVISTNFEYSVGGLSLKASRSQPPIQCFNNNCPRDGLCIPLKDRFRCQCQLGCRDLDPAKAGRICSCKERNMLWILDNCNPNSVSGPCNNPDTNSCGEYAQCIPFDNSDGYVCKCKTGFVDTTSTSGPAISHDQGLANLTSTSPRCVLDYCLQRRNECERKNATCVISADGFECKCSIGYVDVRRNLVKADAICLSKFPSVSFKIIKISQEFCFQNLKMSMNALFNCTSAFRRPPVSKIYPLGISAFVRMVP